MLVLGENILSAVVQLYEGANILTGDFYLILWIFLSLTLPRYERQEEKYLFTTKRKTVTVFINEYAIFKGESHKLNILKAYSLNMYFILIVLINLADLLFLLECQLFSCFC